MSALSIFNPFGLNIFEFFQPILVITTLILLVSIILKLGQGTLWTAFIHFAVGTALIGDSQFLLITHPHFTFGVQIWWHMLFLLGLTSFLWGGVRLKQISYNPMAGSYTRLDFFVSLVLVALTIGGFLYATANPTNSPIEELFAGSIIEIYNLHHLFITAVAVIIAIYMATLERTWRKLLHINIYPIILFIFLMCLQHFLEILSHGNVALGEMVDTAAELTVIAAFLVFDWGLVQFISALNSRNRFV